MRELRMFWCVEDDWVWTSEFGHFKKMWFEEHLEGEEWSPVQLKVTFAMHDEVRYF